MVLGAAWGGAFVARAISVVVDSSRSKENEDGLAIEAAVAALFLFSRPRFRVEDALRTNDVRTLPRTLRGRRWCGRSGQVRELFDPDEGTVLHPGMTAPLHRNHVRAYLTTYLAGVSDFRIDIACCAERDGPMFVEAHNSGRLVPKKCVGPVFRWHDSGSDGTRMTKLPESSYRS